MVERPRSETWNAAISRPCDRSERRRPWRMRRDGGFTEDQVEVLGHALAGLKGEIQDGFDESLTTGWPG